MASYGYGLIRFGPGAAASGMAFQTLTTAQILHALSCRSTHYRFTSAQLPENRPVALPPLRRFLGAAHPGTAGLLVSFESAVVPLVVNEGGEADQGGISR